VQLITDAESLRASFELHRAGWRQAAQQSEEVARKGEDLRSRLTGALHFQLGPRNVELIEFGLRPRDKAGRRKKSAAPPSPEPTPPPKDKAEAVEPAAPGQQQPASHS
jgi:hypothetical protein